MKTIVKYLLFTWSYIVRVIFGIPVIMMMGIIYLLSKNAYITIVIGFSNFFDIEKYKDNA